jgi:hypothetical protein
MAELINQSSVLVAFPDGSQYGNALYHLRKALKQSLAVEVHKQSEGALVVCSKKALGSVLLMLGTLDGYKISRVQE